MISALVLGFSIGKWANYLQPLLVYILSAMMTLSLQGVSHKIFLQFKKVLRISIEAILIGYFLFGIIIFALSWLFFANDTAIRTGFIFIILSPPGVVIIPFALKLNSDIEWSVIGVVAGYFSSLIIIPLGLFLFMEKAQSISVNSLTNLLLWSIIIPFIASRFLRKNKIDKFIIKYRSTFIDILFFILIYVVIGINREVIFGAPELILKITLVLILTLFGGTYIFGKIIQKFSSNRSTMISKQMMFAVKNNGFSAVLALSITGGESSIPSVVLSVVLLLFLIIFESVYSRKEPEDRLMG
jgi:ACR3 family arsenite efflux pump ArsB